MKVKSESEVAQLDTTLRDSMDCSLPGSSVYGIFQARVLEWVAIPFSESKSMPQPVTLKKLKLNSSMKTYKTFRTNTQKRCPFHYRGLECKSRKSRNTWSNRQIWP